MSQPKVKNSLAAKTAKPQKLKCILTQPFPKYRPMVSPEDTESLKQILLNTTDEFKSKCSLGLKASLEKVNGTGKYLCLLLSSKIKPFHLSWQIIHSIVAREQMAKCFCIPNMEDITGDIFGKEYIALLLCEENTKLEHWVTKQSALFPIPYQLLERKTRKTKNCKPTKKGEVSSFDLSELYVAPHNGRAFVPKIIKQRPQTTVQPTKSWSNDFIRFDDNSSEDGNQDGSYKEVESFDILSKFTKKPENISKGCVQSEIAKDTEMEVVPIDIPKEKDVDDWMEDYIGVEVHKIQKNPQAKIKKKKNKNKKQNKL